MRAHGAAWRGSVPSMADLQPRRIVHVDLSAGVPPGGLDDAGGPVLLVAWWRDLPLGYEHIHRGATEAELAARLTRLVAPSIGRRLLGDGYPPPRPGLAHAAPPSLAAVQALADPLRRLEAEAAGEPADGPSASLVVCTRD